MVRKDKSGNLHTISEPTPPLNREPPSEYVSCDTMQLT